MTNDRLNTIRRCIGLLNSPKRGRSRRAEKRLIAIGQDAVEPLIEAAASTRSTEAKLCILWALGLIGDPRGFDAILKFTHDDDSFVRYEAAWALGKLGDKRAIEPLIEFVGSEDDGGVSGSAGNALADMGELAIPRLIETAKSSPGPKRVCALYALGGSTDKNVIDLFAEMLNDLDPSVRTAAVEALARTGEDYPQDLGHRCLQLISTRLDDAAESVRDIAESWANDLQKTVDRMRYARPKPRSHKLRLILSENLDCRFEVGCKIRRLIRRRLKGKRRG